MNRDQYGETINGRNTYDTIARILEDGLSVMIGWTDEEYTHYDILFTLAPFIPLGEIIQRGIKRNDLIVSIIGKGSFGFKVGNNHSAGYISEKLNITSDCTKLAELINGVQEAL